MDKKINITTLTGASLLFFLLVSFFSIQTFSGNAEAQAGKKGTFLLLQAEGGFTSCPYSHITGSLSYGFIMGVGGKFKGVPLRFYLVGAFNNARYWHNDSFSQTGEKYKLVMNFLDVGAGLRVLVPIVPNFRIYIDVIGVGSHQKTELERSGAGALSSSGWVSGAIVAGGAEFRWHKHAATGLRLEGNFYKKLPSSVPQVVGIEERGNGRLFIGLTQSFFF